MWSALFVAGVVGLQRPLLPSSHRPAACARSVLMMCDASADALRAEEAALQQQIKDLQRLAELDISPDPAKMADLNTLNAQLEAKRQEIIAVAGPPPIRYSSVGRMRQQIEGDPMASKDGAAAGGGPKVSADSVMPGGAGLRNIGILLAVLSAAALALIGLVGGG